MSTHPPRSRPRRIRPAGRKAVQLPKDITLVEFFMRCLYWGVDENVPTVRGGWPR